MARRSDLLKTVGDKYRSFLYDEADDIEWRHGGPPTYDDEWPKGSLEECAKCCEVLGDGALTQDSLERTSRQSTLRNSSSSLMNSLPKEFQYYKAEEESFESSHDVLSVYTGPPEIVFKFRHWGFFEGPFKGHAPTGEIVQFYGLATLKVEVYYDPSKLLFGGLLKGQPAATESSTATHECPVSK
ncbi:hypothetical protein RGQ29_027461 [Quercus rubra]|uniref:Pathogen-related protein n=1 Tax=Quercus rubra TaxID=3512 RepID=A0AAN7IKJ6_QUERU|nr:hypothetical protein RGQ29_027461 [Quercus rubra]